MRNPYRTALLWAGLAATVVGATAYLVSTAAFSSGGVSNDLLWVAWLPQALLPAGLFSLVGWLIVSALTYLPLEKPKRERTRTHPSEG